MAAGGGDLGKSKGNKNDLEKADELKENGDPKDDSESIPESTAKKILDKLEKATEERNTIKGFVEC